MLDILDLENVILGVVHKKGPCTPYAVRMEFEQSPSPHFSSSPGSIYPIIARLEKRKLLKSREDATGNRKRRLYRVTALGRDALRNWLTPPLPAESVGLTFDPLRTRTNFLGILKPDEIDAYLAKVAEQLETEIEKSRNDVRKYRESGDHFSWLAASGGLQSLQARLRWLRFVARELKTGPK